MTNADYCVHASSLWSGLVRNFREDQILEAWDQGCLELHYAMAYVAEVDADLCDKLFEKVGKDFPGLWTYEVTEELGAIIAAFILSNEDLPSRERVKSVHTQLILDFFPEHHKEAVLDFLNSRDHWETLP